MRAKRVFEYDRGSDPRKGLRVGRYAPGTVKDFEDVRIGDMAKDYAGTEWEVIDKTTLKIDLENPPINEFFPGVTDPDVVQFLEQYDESGIMMDFLSNGTTPDMHGETEDLIAVYGEHSESVVFIYDDVGALVYW